MKNHCGRAVAQHPWNRFQWHLGGRHLGRGRYVMLHVERLERRSLLAGDLATLDEGEILPDPADETEIIQTMSVAAEDASADETGPVVDLILELTSPDGSPLTSLTAGQDFVLRVLAEDLRGAPHGVFSAYLDIRWDHALAEVAGPLQYAGEFANLQMGDASVAGVIEEAGAFGGFDESGAGPHEILSVPLRALGAGDLAITSDAAETPIYQVLVYRSNDAVPAEDVQFGSAGITIEAAVVEAAPPEESPAPAVEQASEPVDVPLEASSDATVVTDDVDEALEFLVLQTLGAAPNKPASSEAPAANQEQDIPTGSAPTLVVLLGGSSTASASDTGERESDEGDDESDIDSTELDAAALNLL